MPLSSKPPVVHRFTFLLVPRRKNSTLGQKDGRMGNSYIAANSGCQVGKLLFAAWSVYHDKRPTLTDRFGREDAI